jgi:hypothetical protein
MEMLTQLVVEGKRVGKGIHQKRLTAADATPEVNALWRPWRVSGQTKESLPPASRRRARSDERFVTSLECLYCTLLRASGESSPLFRRR